MDVRFLAGSSLANPGLRAFNLLLTSSAESTVKLLAYYFGFHYIRHYDKLVSGKLLKLKLKRTASRSSKLLNKHLLKRRIYLQYGFK